MVAPDHRILGAIVVRLRKPAGEPTAPERSIFSVPNGSMSESPPDFFRQGLDKRGKKK